MTPARESMFLSPGGHFLATVLGTTYAYLRRSSAYVIQLIRWPLGPILTFAAWRVTYSISGRSTVDRATAAGFLLVGIFGLIAWGSTVWASGYTLESERDEGTSGALFLSPASRAAVVAGYGIGSLIWFLPSFVAVAILAFLTGARLDVGDPLALVAAAFMMLFSTLAVGFTLSGLFILSRRGNLIANFIQAPIYLLAGVMVPRSRLPAWLQPLSDAIPASHAIDALRETALLGVSLQRAAPALLWTLGLSTVYALIGVIALRRVERVAKRTGQLELY